MLVHRVECPECGKGIRSSAGVEVGQRVKCSGCGERFRVEADEEEEIVERRPVRKRRPKPRKKANRGPVVLLAAVLGVLVVGGTVAGVVWSMKKNGEPQQANNEPDKPKPDKPGPDKPGPDKPVPDKQGPDKPGPDTPKPPDTPPQKVPEPDRRTPKEKIAARLVGDWSSTYEFQGSVLIHFRADGTFTLETSDDKNPQMKPRTTGTWEVTNYTLDTVTIRRSGGNAVAKLYEPGDTVTFYLLGRRALLRQTQKGEVEYQRQETDPTRYPTQETAEMKKAREAIEQLGGRVYMDTWNRPLGVRLSGSKATTADLALLRHFGFIDWVDLSGCSVTDSGLTHLRGLAIRSLTLTKCSISDAGLTRLKDIKRLTNVFLNSNDVTDAGLAHLEDFLALESLSLKGNPKITDEGLSRLAGLTGLFSLELGNTAVTDAGLPHLSRMKQLRGVGLSGCKVTDAGLGHITQVPSLRSVNLGKTGVTDGGLRLLASMRDLGDLGLEATAITDEGLAHFRGHAQLTTVNLIRTRVTDKAIPHMQAVPRLQIVYAGGTAITQQGADAAKRFRESLNIDLKAMQRE